MPTSRYCDQAPCSISVRFSSAACGEPGTRFFRSPPSCLLTWARIASAFSGAPFACSSMTRSSMERGNVTPAAFTACRSAGGSSQGRRSLRVSWGVLASRSSSEDMRSPGASRTILPGSSISARSRKVGAVEVMSMTPPARTATTDGPLTSGRHARPASAPARPSCGNVAAGVR